MKQVAIVGAVFALLLSVIPAQITGARYKCCGVTQLYLVQYGDVSLSGPFGVHLTTIAPKQGSVIGFLLVSMQEESRPWPLDPGAGWLLVNSSPQEYLGTVMMKSSGSDWEHRVDMPQSTPVGTLLFFQVAMVLPNSSWMLSDGWATAAIQP